MFLFAVGDNRIALRLNIDLQSYLIHNNCYAYVTYMSKMHPCIRAVVAYYEMKVSSNLRVNYV